MPDSSMILSNAKGQQFVCEIPQFSAPELDVGGGDENSDSLENENLTNEDILELLGTSFSIRPCLRKVNDH